MSAICIGTVINFLVEFCEYMWQEYGGETYFNQYIYIYICRYMPV